MKIDYLIIQAGGLGSRLGALTRNRPKALVPVSNKAMIIRLLETFKEARFLIIADYKAEILKRYLETFAAVDYYVLKSEQKGNVAGVKSALEFVPEGNSVAVVWSDLVFPDGFSTIGLPSANYVGTVSGSPCSWGFKSAGLVRSSVVTDGVAGFFIFKDKANLFDLPVEGSLTSWLATNEARFGFQNLPLGETKEFGTPDAFEPIKTLKRTRPYNHLIFSESTVTKTATGEGSALLAREILWYEEAKRLGFLSIPRVHSFEPFEMERLHCDTVAENQLSDHSKKSALENIVKTLQKLHLLDRGPADITALYDIYYRKTLGRLGQVRNAIPFAETPHFVINGMTCRNVLFHRDLFEQSVESVLADSKFGFIHGDCTLSNILLKDDLSVMLIDPRGYFGRRGFLGDVDYDWVKLYFSIYGNFDQFNIRNFSLKIDSSSISVSVASSGWEFLVDDFLSWTSSDEKKIRLIHAIVWLSLASHCADDFDSMASAFYIGIYEFNKWTRDFLSLDANEFKTCGGL
jgi:GTP:adenosylcobinamide-phosphate guanylyltransferase